MIAEPLGRALEATGYLLADGTGAADDRDGDSDPRRQTRMPQRRTAPAPRRP